MYLIDGSRHSPGAFNPCASTPFKTKRFLDSSRNPAHISSARNRWQSLTIPALPEPALHAPEDAIPRAGQHSRGRRAQGPLQSARDTRMRTRDDGAVPELEACELLISLPTSSALEEQTDGTATYQINSLLSWVLTNLHVAVKPRPSSDQSHPVRTPSHTAGRTLAGSQMAKDTGCSSSAGWKTSIQLPVV